MRWGMGKLIDNTDTLGQTGGVVDIKGIHFQLQLNKKSIWEKIIFTD